LLQEGSDRDWEGTKTFSKKVYESNQQWLRGFMSNGWALITKGAFVIYHLEQGTDFGVLSWSHTSSHVISLAVLTSGGRWPSAGLQAIFLNSSIPLFYCSTQKSLFILPAFLPHLPTTLKLGPTSWSKTIFLIKTELPGIRQCNIRHIYKTRNVKEHSPVKALNLPRVENYPPIGHWNFIPFKFAQIHGQAFLSCL
jgi:hypothetical protein